MSDYEDDFSDYEEASPSKKSGDKSALQLDNEFLMDRVKQRDSRIRELEKQLELSKSSDSKVSALVSQCSTLELELKRTESELNLARTQISNTASSTKQEAYAAPKTSSKTPVLDPSAKLWALHKDAWVPREIQYDDMHVGERVSGGGFCIMYEGRWMNTKVAIKRIFDPVISKELKDEFNNEVRLLSFLRHPNIVQLMAVVSKPPSLCLITEFMARGSLYHVLHESSVEMTVRRSLRVSREVIRGIAYIHHAGIVHRDIKSFNVLADEQLQCKICDFGMARFELGDHKDVGGTPVYMAPELFNNQNASRASDVYAVGMLLWEIWVREVPFDGLEVPMIVNRVKAGKRPSMNVFKNNVPKEIPKLVQSMWAQTPSDRPTIAEVYATLEAIVV